MIKTPKTKTLEPAEIFAKLASYPPLMQKEAGAKYIGKWIERMLTFAGGWEWRDETHLTFDVEPRSFKRVRGTVSIAEYPWLKTLTAGTEVLVRGQILHADTMTIELDGLELRLPKGKKSGVRCHSEFRTPNSELRYQRER